MVKNVPAVQKTWVRSLGWEDPLKKGMATHSSILAWEIPWTEGLGRYNPWGPKELDSTERLALSPILRSFGGRRKAVRDRLALQGGTGDFP